MAKKIKTEYLYQNQKGETVFKVVRTDEVGCDKKISQMSLVNGKWIHKGTEELVRPYKLKDNLLSIVYVEGEKCVEVLLKLGLAATTVYGGSKVAWSDHYNQYFPNEVTILADNDKTGFEHAIQVAEALIKAGKKVRFLLLPNLPDAGDVADWLENGGTKEELENLISTSCIDIAAFKQIYASKYPNISNEELLAGFQSADSIEPKEVEWLVMGMLPRKFLSLIAGDPGVGKSTIALNLVASLSRGVSFPPILEFKMDIIERHKSLVISVEDPPNEVMVPRLITQGADLSQIFVYPNVITLDALGLTKISAAVDEYNPSLVVIDPIVAFLPKIDMNKANEMRSCLQGVAELAYKKNICILIVVHQNKNSGETNALFRVNGSVDIGAAARSVLTVTKNDNNQKERYLFHIKSNLGPLSQTFIADVSKGKLDWSTSPLRYEDVYVPDRMRAKSDTQLQTCLEMFRLILKDKPIKSIDVFAQAEDWGISKRTINRFVTEFKEYVIREHVATKGAKRGAGHWEFKKIKELPKPPLKNVAKMWSTRARMSSDCLITVAGLAKRYSVSTKTIYNWVAARKIPFIKLGHLLRFRELDLIEWEKDLKTDPFSTDFAVGKPLSLKRRLIFET